MHKTFIAKQLGAAVLLVFLSACAPRDRVASVGPEKLSADDYRAYLDAYPAFKDQPPEKTLGSLVDETAAAIKAKEMGLVKERTFGLANQNFQRDFLASEYLRVHYAKDLEIDDATLHSAYMGMAERRKLSHILVKEEGEAKEIFSSLRRGGDFAEMAKKRSTDSASAQQGGQLGWIDAASLDPSFVDGAFGLKEGETSLPFKSSFGWHIARCEGVEHADPSKLKQNRDQVRLIIQKRVAEKLKEQAYQELSKSVKVSVFDDVLQGDYTLDIDAEDLEKVVATAGTSRVTLAELKDFMGGFFSTRGQSHVMGPQAKKEFLSLLLRSTVLAEGAKTEGIQARPSVLAALREFERSRLAELAKQKVLSDHKVSAEELQAWYSTKPKELAPGDELHLYFVILQDEGSANAAKGALASGKSFESVAREYSSDPTAKENSGDAGWIPMSSLSQSLPKDAADALAASKPGETLGPFLTGFGIQLFKVAERRPGSPIPLKGNEESIANAYKQAFAARIWEDQLQNWREDLGVRLYPKHLQLVASK